MPPEPQLIERFQISRTVIREVMKTLAAKGVVISKTRVGTRVRERMYWNYFDADVLAWRVRLGFDDGFMHCLVEVRRAIEPAAAALAAERRSGAHLTRLKECIREMSRAGHSRQSFAEADLNFHLVVGDATGNPMMRSVAGVIETALLAAFMHSSPVDDPAAHQYTFTAHAAVVDAIEASDAAGAATTMLKVINSGVERIELRRRRQSERR
jgi:DNA-binding FadR family transcriptional regulator